jgi:hypothetical protein
MDKQQIQEEIFVLRRRIQAIDHLVSKRHLHFQQMKNLAEEQREYVRRYHEIVRPH